MTTATENATMTRGRCTHGLKAGLCNTCPAHRREDNRWVWDATPIHRGHRTYRIGGYRFKVNRHGVALRECKHSPDGWRGVSFDWCDDTTRAVKDAFEDESVGATCGNATGYCSCPARF